MTVRLQGALPPRKLSDGAVLLVSLVLLVAISLLGISAMQGTIMQERMSVNQRDVEIAFNGAESALRAGEHWLQEPGNAAVALANLGLDDIHAWDPQRSAGKEWGTQGNVTGAVPVVEGFEGHPLSPVQASLYHVSWRGEYCEPGAPLSEPCDDIFVVGAHGSGASQRGQAAVSILQSVYVLP